ncbi:hypothetical protein CNEO_170077 [Clostridium neonatale]|uniref:hypothetical protein n=1 Tax=Clostridium neonatale TaxID=137838 RepID=UPI001D7623F5|nr:hypothetical protein [Clostridium neonatale]CAG9702658.1 hypothetical protein CNEO_170077 [Clostridium neonatale]
MELQFRPLKANEIDVRIAQVREKGLSLLLYKDARCDMNILDETVGPFGWKREHKRENANCIVSLWDSEKEQWISKEDTGAESFTEKEKGLASDSFKRACFNWGIGRELYTAPFIWVTNAAIFKQTINGKDVFKCNDKFEVKEIQYDENKNIIGLVIKNITNKKQAYPNYSGSSNEETTPEEPTNTTPKTYKCKICGNEVTEKVAKFSYGKHGKILCMDCQKTIK